MNGSLKHLIGALLIALSAPLLAATDWSVFASPQGLGALAASIGSVLYGAKMVNFNNK